MNTNRLMSLLTLVATIATGCNQADEPPAQGLISGPVTSTPVSTALPTSAQLIEPIFSTGTVVAQKSTDLVPMVGGLIEEIYVAVGDRVEQGQPLLRMRKKDFQIEVDRLMQGTMLAEAELQDAERDLANAITLNNKDVYSTEQLDDRRTRVDVTAAKLGIAQALLLEAEKKLDDSVMRAPYRGVITRRNVDEGAYVPSVMRSGNPLLQIQKIDVMVALLFIPEAHLRSIKLGTLGQINIPSLDQTYDSEIHLINDRLQLKTRTIELRLLIANEDYLIKPGLFIEVKLMPKARTAIIIPADAVKGLGSDRYLYIVKEGAAAHRQVKVRELEDGRLELISGIDPEDRIIIGPDRYIVRDKMPVVTRN